MENPNNRRWFEDKYVRKMPYLCGLWRLAKAYMKENVERSE